MSATRDASIELWRIVCMTAVVFSHVITNNNVASFSWFSWHIPGFLLISGYFGIRFSWYKISKLLTIVYALYWLTIPLRSINENVTTFLLPHGGWFVPFYLVMMVLSPMMEAALEKGCRVKTIVFPAVFLLFVGWVSSLSVNPHVGMMRIPGMQGSGMLLMIAAYVLGRFVSENKDLYHKSILLVMFIFVLTSWRIGCSFPRATSYISPLAIGAAMCGLIWCSKLKLPDWLSRIILFVSPSMFGVYIVHECCLRSWQFIEGDVGWCRCILRALFLFAFSLLVDLVRRSVFWVLSRAYKLSTIRISTKKQNQ